jgi:hypothetical protein
MLRIGITQLELCLLWMRDIFLTKAQVINDSSARHDPWLTEVLMSWQSRKKKSSTIAKSAAKIQLLSAEIMRQREFLIEVSGA